MKVYSRYEHYIAAISPLDDSQPVYIGEILSQSCREDKAAEGTVICFMWKNESSIELCKTRVKDGGREVLMIEEIFISPDKDELVWKAFYDDEVRGWLDMCHFRKGDEVRYDPYYDTLPAFEASAPVCLGDLRGGVIEWMSANFKVDDVDIMYVYGSLASDNIICELLSSRYGLDVRIVEEDMSVSDYVRYPGARRRVLLEKEACKTLFGHFSADDIMREHDPDIRFKDIPAFVLDIRTDFDMMGNGFLNVKYLDGTDKTFVKINERFL